MVDLSAFASTGQGRSRSVHDLIEIVAPKLSPLCSMDGEEGSKVVRDVCVLIEQACKEERGARYQTVGDLLAGVLAWRHEWLERDLAD